MEVLNSFEGLIALFVILTIGAGFILKKMGQPYIISYILVGILLGDHGLEIIQETETIRHLGEIGIILLMFFIGMEISLPEILKTWKIALFGTISQVIISVAIMFGVGYFLDWQTARIIVIGFAISLSSSAVIIKLLEERGLINSQLGKNVLSILIMQDMLIVPMLVITSFLGGEKPSNLDVTLLIIGGVIFMGILVAVYRFKKIRLPFSRSIENDHELQVFVSLLFCFGGALLSSVFGLSPGLGAFVGGMVMHAGKATAWIHDALNSFRVLFVAIFFVSVGLQIDLDFIRGNVLALSLVLLFIYITNHLLNAIILKAFKSSWKEALLGGALLAQVGEMSFLLSYSAFQAGIILEYGYNFSISLISLTLILSPFWIALSQSLIRIKKPIL